MVSIRKKWNNIPLTVKVSVAYAFCSIIQRCLSFITLPLFTRLLTTEQYGQYTIYSSWSAIISIFITLNLAYGSFSTAMVKFEKDRDGYISSVQGIFIVLAVMFFVIYIPFRELWNELFELPTNLVILFVFEVIFQNTFLLWCGKKRFEYKYKGVVALTLIMSVASPVLALILVKNTNEKGYARIIGYAVITIAVGCVLYFVEAIKGKKLYNEEYWDYAFGFNVPLLIYYLSQYVFNQSDRIMISHMVGKDKAGIYGVAYSLAVLLVFVLNAINNSYVPWFYGRLKEGKTAENKKIADGIAVLMMLLLSFVIWFAPEIMLIMAGEAYVEAVYVVAPVAVSIFLLFYSQLFVNVEFYFEEKKRLVKASVFAAVVNIVLNYVFIQMFGFVAAAYTTVVSYIIFCISNYLVMKRVLQDHEMKDEAYDYVFLIKIFIVFCVEATIGVLLYGLLPIRIVVSLIVAVIMIVNRKDLLYFYTIKRNQA